MKNLLLKSLINKHAVISFDIFDTLIERMVEKPSDIFLIVGRIVLGEGQEEEFCIDRKRAEFDARAEARSGEATLETIYEKIPQKYITIKEKLKITEIEVELKYCKPKMSLLSYFHYALKLDKPIYLISDMYLSSDIIEQMLQKCGIRGYQKIYVSNEYEKNKISGQLFTQVIEDNEIKKKEMFHIGDSIKADFIGARRVGISSFLIRRKNRIGRLLR